MKQSLYFSAFLLSSLLSFASPFSLKMSDNKVFALNAKFSIKPSRREEFISIIRNDQTETLEKEPKALQFVVGEDTENVNTFYLHEQYIGEEGFQEHTETPHFAEWMKFTESDPFEEGGAPAVDFFFGTHAPQKIDVRKAYCLNVEICVQEKYRDEFIKVIENNAKGSNNDEKLCLQYSWGESKEVANAFYFHEQYTGDNEGREGFDVHATMPHFKVWEELAAKEPFSKPPVVSFYRTL